MGQLSEFRASDPNAYSQKLGFKTESEALHAWKLERNGMGVSNEWHFPSISQMGSHSTTVSPSAATVTNAFFPSPPPSALPQDYHDVSGMFGNGPRQSLTEPSSIDSGFLRSSQSSSSLSGFTPTHTTVLHPFSSVDLNGKGSVGSQDGKMNSFSRLSVDENVFRKSSSSSLIGQGPASSIGSLPSAKLSSSYKGNLNNFLGYRIPNSAPILFDHGIHSQSVSLPPTQNDFPSPLGEPATNSHKMFPLEQQQHSSRSEDLLYSPSNTAAAFNSSLLSRHNSLRRRSSLIAGSSLSQSNKQVHSPLEYWPPSSQGMSQGIPAQSRSLSYNFSPEHQAFMTSPTEQPTPSDIVATSPYHSSLNSPFASANTFQSKLPDSSGLSNIGSAVAFGPNGTSHHSKFRPHVAEQHQPNFHFGNPTDEIFELESKSASAPIRAHSPTSAGLSNAVGHLVLSGNSSSFMSSKQVSYSSEEKQSDSATDYTTRNKILHDIRNNKHKKLEIKQLVGHLAAFSTDQHGSRFLQQKIETCSDEDRALLFHDIVNGNCLQLMMDVFGNYVVQKLLEFGTDEQREVFTEKMKGHVLTLSLQMYGCRVAQKALEHIPLNRQVELIQELDGDVLKCVKDQNGNHVIQKAIECIPYGHLQFVVDAVMPNVYNLSSHPYGCRVIQRIIEHFADARSSVYLQLHTQILHLAQDQYGNYVIQHLMKKGSPSEQREIVEVVLGNVLHLSRHKFASNVVERCISYCSDTDRERFFNSLLGENEDGDTYLLNLIKDKYANYVIQKLIDVSKPELRDRIITVLNPHLNVLKNYTYGKHLYLVVEKFQRGNAEEPSENSKTVMTNMP
ncbi:RNA-binding protein Puf3 [Schizosaccharomyces japonicus yFS275]|uniref:Pumilio homology domain family member 3 n=1 Tax=Schizosaccharomyces japonicus (strain yFS275 / FY16936) TaxID=402676 RepID=B6JWB2_SCHJY|nr:RNA-binding protein Puf3 [Schizosaccharomyces japonicus yFS275]EEB05663.1 RNA-binding protein Puf3 [Schizosaccharomyces japonicus yFS275]